MNNAELTDCAHCGATGKDNCDGCISSFEREHSIVLKNGSSVICGACRGAGKFNPAQKTFEANSSISLRQPSLTLHLVTEEQVTSRQKNNNQKQIAILVIMTGLLILILSLTGTAFGATLITVGTSIIANGVGAYFGGNVPVFKQKIQDETIQ